MTDAEAARQSELEQVVRAAVARHVGAPVQVAPLSGGLTNEAFDVETAHAHVVVRLGDQPDKLAGFERERRAAGQARAAGVPTQQIIALGNEGRWAYTIAERLPGEPAVDHPERLRILEELGRVAKVVHGIRTDGFGDRFALEGETADPPQPGAETWSDFLREHLQAESRIARLLELEMISGRQAESLRRALTEVEGWDGPAVLNHGDLRLKNVVVNEEGHILGVIDWESAISVVGPHWDLSIALHDLSIDAKQAFLSGYGMSDDEVRRAAPAWRLFNLLNYVPTIDERLAAHDTEEVERIRTRLSGALDLYAGDEVQA
jgi:aminoglycoside phosphotransferase (APT) family kinase protein